LRNVSFENAHHLSYVQKSQLIQRFHEFNPADGADEHNVLGVEQAILAAYADKGYWDAKVKVAILPSGDDRKMDLTVRVLQEGRQYRLGKIAWTGAHAFPESQLTDLMPFVPGHILERTEIADGLEAIHKLYSEAGYLEFSAVPQIVPNQGSGKVDLQIVLQEGGAFTVQGFSIVGVKPEIRDLLLKSWPFKPGDIYSGESIENFLSAHASMLPPMGPADVVCRSIDLSNHTIEFLVDFRPQPLACNAPSSEAMASQSLNSVSGVR
jgi:outer membrane protein assembly factor BamA